jgi:hypothetical protein
MNEIKDLKRYWVDGDSGIFVREWTDEEYKTNNPQKHIFEKYWSYRCPICSFIPTPHFDKAETEHGAKTHERHAGSKHKCVVENRNHELICLEHRYEFMKDLGVWIHKQEYYTN